MSNILLLYDNVLFLVGISQTFDVKLIILDFFLRGEGIDLSLLKQAHFGHASTSIGRSTDTPYS